MAAVKRQPFLFSIILKLLALQFFESKNIKDLTP
jgi:hypothetical protein